jgi:hypothetical protein
MSRTLQWFAWSFLICAATSIAQEKTSTSTRTLVCPRSKVEIYSRYAIHQDTTEVGVLVPFFGNRACPMSGDPVLPDAYYTYQGQRVYFCCKKCARDGELRAEVWWQRAYPAAHTLLTLGAATTSADPEPVFFQGFEIRCKNAGDRAAFLARPLESLLQATAKQAREDRPDCPVTQLPGQADIVAIYRDRILRFAHWQALATFVEDPDHWQGPPASPPKELPRREL